METRYDPLHRKLVGGDALYKTKQNKTKQKMESNSIIELLPKAQQLHTRQQK